METHIAYMRVVRLFRESWWTEEEEDTLKSIEKHSLQRASAIELQRGTPDYRKLCDDFDERTKNYLEMFGPCIFYNGNNPHPLRDSPFPRQPNGEWAITWRVEDPASTDARAYPVLTPAASAAHRASETQDPQDPHDVNSLDGAIYGQAIEEQLTQPVQ